MLPLFDTVTMKVTESSANAGFSLDESATDVACTTFCARTGEVLGRLFASPAYAATIKCGPGSRPETTSVAIPDELRFEAPSVVVPSLNVTVPVTLPPVPTTVDVNVSGALAIEGFALEISVTVVPAVCTVCTNALEAAA